MFNAILAILEIMGWLGVILAMLLFVNTSCKTLYNVGYKGEDFQWKKMLKGIVKAIFFYLGAALTAVSFTLLPFVNTMIIEAFGVVLITQELLNTLSSVSVLSTIVAAVVLQAKKAITSLLQLANMVSDTLKNENKDEEEITWNVEDE